MNNKEYYVRLNARLNDTQKTVTELNAQIKSLQNKITSLEIKVKMPTNTNKGFTDLDTQLNKLKVSMSDFKDNILSTRSTFDTVTTRYTDNAGKILTVTKKMVNGQKQYKASLKEVNSAVETNAKQADQWRYSWSKAFQSFTTYMSVTQVFYTIKNTIIDMINEVTDLDSALVELQKVSSLTGDGLQSFVNDAYEAAEGVAKTGTEMVSAATEFAKAGYSESEILKLGEVALMYTNIADEAVSASEASEFMIAQMKAFNIEAEDSMHIIDAVNEVANKYAVSSADIANNLGASSAVMANAGNSYEQMIGLLTAGTEITRNASKVSNGLKTITLRMQGMDDEGETNLDLVAQMEQLYSKLGISVYNSNGELKNTFELLETLAPIYQEATAAEKAYITETIAGKYQAQNAAAILNNFSTAISATETALNSQGSAVAENEKVLGSIKGKINQIGSEFEKMSQKFINSGFVKVMLDLGAAILKFVNSDLGSLTFAITAAALNTRILANSWGMLRNKLVDLANSTSLYELKLKGVNVNNVKVLASNTTLSNSFKLVKTNSQAAAVGLDLANTKSRLLSLSFNTITTSIKAMSKAMLSNPIFWGTLAVEGIIALVNWADKAHKSIDELYNDAKTKYSDTTSELEDVNSELSSITSRIEELQSKGPLSFTEKSELDNLKEQTKELLLQKQLLDEREKKEKEKLEKSAQLKVEDVLNDKTTYTEKKEKVTDTSFLNKFQSMFPSNGSLVGENGLLGFTSEDISDVDNYIAALEKLRKQYSNNKLALQMIDEEMNRVKNTVGATQIVEQETSTTVNKAVENNKKSYEDYTKKIQENKDKIKEYQKEIEEYEKSNPLVVDAEKKGKTPTFNNDEDKQDYLQYKAAQGSLDALTKENEKYTQSQEQTKENLKEQAEIYENLLSDTELQSSLSEEQLEKLKSQLIEIYKIIDPNKLKGMKMDEILTSGDYSDAVSELLDFKDAGEVTEEQVESLREKFPEFDEALGDISSEEAAEHMNSLTDSVYNLASGINDTTVSIQEKLSGIASSFDILSSAVDEYNQSGYITASTFASLVDNNLVQYLQVTTDGIIMNANALYQMEAAAKDAQLATWQLAAAEDIHKLALGDTEKLSPIAKTALENLRIQTKKNAYSFLDAAGKLALFNQELKKKKEIEKGNLNPEIDPAQFEKDADAIIALYEKYAASMVYTSATAKKASVSSGGGSSSSSSSSKSDKEWWETEFEKLKDQFNYNEITIEEYINGLSNLLGKVQQGTEAWRKINEELQKQRLTKVEDDYKRGTISLDEYIAKLKELIKAYKQGTEAWNELADKIKEGLQDKLDKQKDDLETAESAAVSIIDKEIEKLEDLRDAEEERYDKLIEQKEKANEETERELELAQLQEALENAKKEKTKRVWREGLGKKSAKYKGNYIGQMLEIVQTEVRLCLGGALWV